ncbi:RNA 2',3'-cyclic phosphodiesterase [Nitriliruptoraceae bacterium ZYF776]|nr:RNA 2',3'-cyclic phosphodiesterase [Profundirhabdus halotolerans]
MSRQRLFVALPIPDHVRMLGVAARAPAEAVLPALGWTRPEGWHVTLAFLGEVADDDVPRVGPVVAEVARRHAPIGCHLGAAGRFGDRVLWLGVEDDPVGAIAALGDEVQGALAAAELPVRVAPVRPHLTLARGRSGGVGHDHVAAVAPVTVGWEVAHLEVVRSHLGDGPARYETLERLPLAAG